MKHFKHFKKNRAYVLSDKDYKYVLKKLPLNHISLAVTSPPYFIGKEYDTTKSIEDFKQLHGEVFKLLVPRIKVGGSICWQVGYHVTNNTIIPLDYLVYSILSTYPELNLRNRIIWTYGHGLHENVRFSGRHEVILWFTKGEKYTFNLDNVRVPQKYPGKRSYRGDNKGKFSGNPLGKNPSDIWDLPNVKSNHVEKTIHPCQFPIGLVERLILALSNEGDTIYDPFMGSGSTAAASVLTNRKFVGSEINSDYYAVAIERYNSAINGELKYRPLLKPIFEPSASLSVARKPVTFMY